ncbi:ROK family protein [Granulicella sp. dw_53]|uniref:ROK family protein n=1 Tax=Granulicella sp. dw_53 TaxID=2719792 RepID=UPI001BD644D3|nr:ROK family protein [Granulicella sp. dw_53]
MSAPTVANVVSDLNDLGIIEWIGEGVSGGGRRPENLRFKADYGCLAGVDVTADSIRILLTDLNGTLIEEQHEPLPKDARTPNAVIEVLRASLRTIMQRHSLPWKKLLAVTVGVAGITNVRDGIVISVSDANTWRDVPFRDMLKQHLPCSIFIENDTNLAAIGEHFRGIAQSEDSFIFVSVGLGVGAGIFLNGRIVHGASWSAGEIGYLHIPNVSSVQPLLYEFGRLEQVLGGPGILRSWNAVSNKSGAAVKARKASNVLDLALEGNAAAQKLVLQRARLLKDVVLNLSLTLNPGLFVFGGDLGAHAALLEPTVEMLHKSEVAVARVLPSSLGSSAVVWGAVAVAMQDSEQRLISLLNPTGGKM